MTEPRSGPSLRSSSGMPCLQQRKTLRRLTDWTRSQASSVVSRTEPSSFGEMPALLNRTSIRPKRSRASR